MDGDSPTKTTGATTGQCRRGGVDSAITGRTLTTTCGALAQSPRKRTCWLVKMSACTRDVPLTFRLFNHQVRPTAVQITLYKWRTINFVCIRHR